MHGNVWEWAQDCWNRSYQGAPTNGSAWESGDCSLRVLRGGSWVNAPWLLRSAIRDPRLELHLEPELRQRVPRGPDDYSLNL